MDIIFDMVGVMTDLRQETKEWALTLLKGANAISALLGRVNTTVRTVERQAKRSVTAFDKLNRLEGRNVTVTTVVTKEQGALQTLQDQLKGVIGTIDNAVGNFGNTVIEKLKAFGSWDAGGILRGLSSILTGVSAVQALLSGDASVALWLGVISGGISAVGNKVGSLTGILGNATGAFSGLSAAAIKVWGSVSSLWGGAADWFSGKLFAPLGTGVKGTVNMIIAMLNGAMTAGVTAINTVGKILNALNFKVPSWIPVLGGKSFGFALPNLTAPKIPYLAQGAVLPANKPFLAMVGDQKNGTNIEAPLTTIQEAVALVMDDQTNAITAGFEATVGIQREILEAVLGISIGDEVIARAGDRYRQKMAVAQGGALWIR